MKCSLGISNFLEEMCAAAKSLQSSDSVWPHRRQPTRFLCPWDPSGKNTGVGCHFLFQSMHACMLSHFSHVRLCATLWTAAHQAPLSTGLSRQEYWSGLPFPSPILHMVIYIFQCYSLNLSHLLLPLLCPKVCSLCFYSCPANRFKSIFLVYFTGICTCHESTLEHFHPML